MRKYLYISPVGTSILRNYVLDKANQGIIEKYSDMRPREWFRLSPDDPLNTVPSGFLCNPPVDLEESLRGFLRRDPRRASAEINGLLAIRDLYGHGYSDIDVLLIATKTCNSMLAARLIEEILRGLGMETWTVTVEAMRSVEEFEEGVVELLDRVVPAIRERHAAGGNVYISATPGFKPETTFLVIASLLAGADSIVYIHEAFREPVALPAPPIRLDDSVRELLGVYGGDECVEISVLNESLGSQVVSSLLDKGLLRRGSDPTLLCLRRWVRRLADLLG